MTFKTRDARREPPSVQWLRQVARPASRVAVGAALLLSLSACGHIEPWVKPYERAALADPIMSGARDPVANEYLHHVYEVREGARGASGSAGGGCGCN